MKNLLTKFNPSNMDNQLLALAITPIWGLAFLMFLPFVGFYLSAQALISKIVDVVSGVKPEPKVVEEHR